MNGKKRNEITSKNKVFYIWNSFSLSLLLFSLFLLLLLNLLTLLSTMSFTIEMVQYFSLSNHISFEIQNRKGIQFHLILSFHIFLFLTLTILFPILIPTLNSLEFFFFHRNLMFLKDFMTFKSKWKLNDVCSNVKWSATILFISCWMHLTRTPTEISYSSSSSYSILFLFFSSFTQWINSFIFIGVILYSNVLDTEMKAWKLQNIVNWFNSIWCQIVINSADWGTFSITSFSICICCCIALHYITFVVCLSDQLDVIVIHEKKTFEFRCP